MKYVFLSTESEHAVAYALMEQLKKIDGLIADLTPMDYSEEIDSIAIIPICIPELMKKMAFQRKGDT